jgi:hypothetical protein
MGDSWRAPEPTDEQKRADELKAAGLVRDSFSGRVVPIPTGPAPTAAEVDAGWAAIRAEAAANTAQREAQDAAQRAEQNRLWTESEAQKSAAWERYVTLAGRALEGGTLADRRLFDETWQRHLAQRAILESAAAVDG